MKKISVIVLLGLTGFTVSSCNSSSGGSGAMSDAEKKNLEVAQAIAKMFESGDFSKVGDYIAADAIDHAGMGGEVTGLDNIKANFAKVTAEMGDFKNQTVQEVASGDYVYQWLNESSTMKVDDQMMGKAGTHISMSAVEVSKFKDGKVSEHWTFINQADLMKMMPQTTMNNMPMKADTSKMGKK